MAVILGIDYGQKNIGVAIATTPLAEPLTVLDNDSQLFDHLNNIIQAEAAESIIIGISEGEMARLTQEFGQKLAQVTQIPIKYYDETLSSYEAKQKLSHASWSKRTQPQDAYQATIMLQNYLDSLETGH